MLGSLLALQEAELLSVENSAQIFNLLSDVPGDVQEVDELLQVQYSSQRIFSEFKMFIVYYCETIFCCNMICGFWHN